MPFLSAEWPTGTPLQVDLRDFMMGRGQLCLWYILAGNHICFPLSSLHIVWKTFAIPPTSFLRDPFLLIPWSRIHLEHLTVAKLAKKLPCLSWNTASRYSLWRLKLARLNTSVGIVVSLQAGWTGLGLHFRLAKTFVYCPQRLVWL
jgi:hypothetical protein